MAYDRPSVICFLVTMGKCNKTNARTNRSEAVVQKCLDGIEAGMTRYAACKKFTVPVSTVRYRMSDRWQNKHTPGPRSVLSKSEEKRIVQWLCDMQKRGFPATREGLLHKVSELLAENSRETPFKNGVPG